MAGQVKIEKIALDSREILGRIPERKLSLIIGHSLAWFFLGLSAYYYVERLTLIDAAYYTFNILNDESFFIAHYRYINFTNQWLPILLIKSGAGLKAIMLGYSMSFTLFYYVIFLIIAYLFKNHRAALFMYVALMLTAHYKHFVGVSETTNTLALSFLFIGWVTREDFNVKIGSIYQPLIALILVLILIVGHPIIGIPLLGFVGFYMSFRGWLPDWRAWSLPLMVILLLVLRYQVYPMSGYETNKMNPLQQDLWTIIKNLKDQWALHHMKDYFIRRFIPSFLLYGTSLFILFKNKKTIAALVSLMSFLGFALLIIFIYPQWNSNSMLESYYLFIGYLWAAAIFAAFSVSKKRFVWFYGLFIMVMLYSSYKIWRQGEWFSQRLEYIYAISENGKENGTCKTFYPQSWVDWGIIDAPWAVAFSSLIYSTINNPEDTRTVYLYRKEKMKNYPLDDPNLFLGPVFEPLKFNGQPLPKYFNLKAQRYYPVLTPEEK